MLIFLNLLVELNLEKKLSKDKLLVMLDLQGISTGPHLHYEVVVNGKKVNSQKLKLPSGKILKGRRQKKI